MSAVSRASAPDLHLLPSVLWLAAMAIAAISSGPGFWFLSIGWSFVSMLMAVPLVIWAAALIFAGSIEAWRHRKSWRVAAISLFIPLLFTLAGFLMYIPLVQGSTYVMTFDVLLKNESKYSSIIRRVQAGTMPTADIKKGQTPDGTLFDAENASPHRVVFETTGWNSMSQGILYDPAYISGRPGHVHDYHWSARSCWHMIESYYACGFDQDGE